MYEFWIYDGADRVGLLERWTSVQWLEQYADAGEAKITALATPENAALLAEGRRIYNPDTGTAARILRQTIEDDGAAPTLTLRCAMGAAALDGRVVMGTEIVAEAEAGMLALAAHNLRGLSLAVAPAAGFALPLDTQVSWGSVLEGEKTLAAASGLGFGCTFDPAAGAETFRVLRGTDRTAGDAYNGYLGDDIANLSDLKLDRGTDNYRNVAVVCGQGEGAARRVVVVGSGEGDARRELYVDARDLSAEYQTAAETGEIGPDGSPVYGYTAAAYTDEEYAALLAARGLEKLAEHGTTLTLSAQAADGSPLTYGKDYRLGDILPVKLTRYGVLAAARVTGVKLIYEAGGRQVLPVLQNLKVEQAAQTLAQTRAAARRNLAR